MVRIMFVASLCNRITSYNVCYTKLLRIRIVNDNGIVSFDDIFQPKLDYDIYNDSIKTSKRYSDLYSVKNNNSTTSYTDRVLKKEDLDLIKRSSLIKKRLSQRFYSLDNNDKNYVSIELTENNDKQLLNCVLFNDSYYEFVEDYSKVNNKIVKIV